MKKEELIALFTTLSRIFKEIGTRQEWKGFEIGISQEEYEQFNQVIFAQDKSNAWFTEENIRKALISWSILLEKESLATWLKQYSFSENKKTIALILAGNIPLVGFHDFLAVLLSGNKANIKFSSKDNLVFNYILKLLVTINPDFSSCYEISTGKLNSFDAVIATGSDNSQLYFEQYFGKYPHIFRKNRTSIAILTGNESKDELNLLGKDIFTYFGLGCRNVSKIYIPKDYNLDHFFEAIYDFHPIINHHKYANNYDYTKAVGLLNKTPMLDNGFFLLIENSDLHSPLASIYVERYEDINQLQSTIQALSNEIQVTVGKDYTPFGQAQEPGLSDYADNIDTMKWLNAL